MIESTKVFHALPYLIGCPVWNWASWRGSIYPSGAPQKRWLHHYSTKFNCVEGNTTFYGIPSEDTAARWADETIDGFRFALKFPKVISHEKGLLNIGVELEAFLNVLSILAASGRLGPTFLQLPPYFSSKQFSTLASFLRQLPNEFPFAVELRNLDWYQAPIESELDGLLEELFIDRVVFDSRPLFSSPPSDDDEEKARTRKPRMPVRKNATSQFPMLRLIGRNEITKVDPWIDEWTDQVKVWINEGRTPLVFAHAPDDTFAPALALRFHQELQNKIDQLGSLPQWEPPPQQQLDLFSS